MAPARYFRGRGAFTLIEVVACLLIAALLAAAVALSLGGVRSHARLRDAVERFTQFERQAREHARRHREPSRLVIDLAEQRVAVVGVEEDGAPTEADRFVAIPEGCRIAEVRTAGEAFTDGEVALACSRRGQTPDYAVRLEGPSGRDNGGGASVNENRWLLIIGATGEATSLANGDEAQRTLALLVPKEGRT